MAGFLKNLFDKKGKNEKVDLSRRYELIARVGQGSMSKVWRARDVMSGKPLAVKVLDKVKTERFEARFIGLNKPPEGVIASSLQHPNIVKTIEFGTTNADEPYLIMEFVEGVSLSYLVDTQNEQMKDNCLNYIIQIGEALDYLHRQNWIHRDLCPRNVMIDPDNVVKLIDFGLVVPNTPDFQKPGNRTGTANYMAPELIKRQRTDQRIDIYSFAVTCYEMYTKKLPWDVAAQETLDTVLQHVNKPPKPIQQMAPNIDPRVAEVIMRGLKSNPSERWQSVAEMLVPLRKAHEEIEKKKAIERKRKAAAAKNPPAPATKSPTKKADEDDDFYAELMLGETKPSSKKPAGPAAGSSKSATPSKSATAGKSPATATAKSTTPVSKQSPTASSKLSAATKPAPQPIDDADEFDGIEIESSPDDEFAGIEVESSPDDEFEGIEVEVEGSDAGSSQTSEDEPLLQLPDDDRPTARSKKSAAPTTDDDLMDGIEIEVEGPA